MQFSVVVCTHNGASRLRRSLGSVLAQEAADFELVVVDDGSTDDTAAVVRSHDAANLRYVWRPNGGLSAARNTGLREARGQFVVYLDDDDWADPDWLRTLAGALDDTTGVVTCGAWMHGPDGSVEVQLPRQMPEAFGGVTALFLAGTFAVRRSLYEAIGGYAEDIPTSHQSEVALRLVPALARAGLTVATVDRPLVHIERRAAGPRRRRPDTVLRGAEYLIERHHDRLVRSPDALADYHAVAAVAAAQLGDRHRSRHHFRSAFRLDPTNPRHALRFVVSHVPFAAAKIWGRHALPAGGPDGRSAAPAEEAPSDAAPTPRREAEMSAGPATAAARRAPTGRLARRLQRAAALARPAVARGILAGQRSGRAGPDADHLAAAVAWLGRAQDATPDGGVAASYSLLDGWNPSYPETTGYIVPTLLHHAEATGDDESRRRARRMGGWLAEVQRADGSIGRGLWEGPADADKPAEVFNTGQVLFAYLALTETGLEPLEDAARRAAGWLRDVQNPDGSWTAHALHGVPHTYYTRVTWALARAGRLLDEPDLTKAAGRAVDWALAQRREGGWIDRMAFTPGTDPLTHTVAYTIEGLLECGLVLDHEAAWRAGVEACEAFARSYRAADGCRLPSGGVAATLRPDWRGSATYDCPTGTAQLALCCRRVAAVDGREDLREVADDLLRAVKLAQAGPSAPPELRGGVPGSMPIWGRYASFKYLNWATKFAADALLDAVTGGLPRLRYG